MIYCELRHLGNVMHYFKSTPSKQSLFAVDFCIAMGKGTFSIKRAIDIYGIQNVLAIAKHKEHWHYDINVIDAKRSLENWRKALFNIGFVEAIQLEVYEDEGNAMKVKIF